MTKKTNSTNSKSVKPTCGIIMPISQIDNCSSEHWSDVLGILKDICNLNDFTPNLVSDADDVGIIHNRIIENIYSSDIVICDVSCKNANVMFELGMRLAFDKPTIIIKDDSTGYSFDTSLIEHLEYPRDLRFTSILKFKENLGNKLKATHKKATDDPNYSTFLKNFGKYKIAHLEDKEVTSDAYLLNAIEDLKRDVRVIRNTSIHNQEDSDMNRNIKRNGFSRRITQKDRNIFNIYVQEYLNEKNLKHPKEISTSMKQIIDDLENNDQLTSIAGDPQTFKALVKESLF